MKRLLTVFVILMLASSVMPIMADGDAPFPTKDWAVSTPEEQGMDSVEIANLIQYFSEPAFNFDSLMVVRHGYVVAEAYSAPVQKDIPHHLASISKTIEAMLVGIALDQGYIKSLDEKVLSFFPDITPANMDERKANITIRNLLDMTTGMNCDAFTDPLSDSALIADGVDAKECLGIPMNAAPSEKFQYCQCNCYLLTRILTQVTGMDMMAFAQKYLFDPIGISGAVWKRLDSEDLPVPWAGLQLKTADIARFAYLLLHQGQWDGKQIISSQFVKDAMTGHHETSFPGLGWGYEMWTLTGTDIVIPIGAWGQYIIINPSQDLIVIHTGGFHDTVRLMTHAGPFITQALALKVVDQALPANPEGTGQLKTLIETLAKPQPQPVKTLPETVKTINDLNYALLEPMWLSKADAVLASVKIGALSFSFDGGDQFVMALTPAEGQPAEIAIGLDGIYRVSSFEGAQVAAKGEWIGEHDLRIYFKVLGHWGIDRIDVTFLPGGGLYGVVLNLAGTWGVLGRGSGNFSGFAAEPQ